ncbi:MAG: T9SS type A sorting domain-containing protein [Candidatus Electryonea clarkiae]|nr:T9SS type A sorting domain-containing protein [Candidatus Electryonea clarkiae]MDP8288293.1 T9SS type A sorting domain-containing protein [Candidatus Electryonea clarkiae]
MYGLRKFFRALLIFAALILVAGQTTAQDSLGISILDARQSLDLFYGAALYDDYMIIAAGRSGMLVISDALGENPEIVAQVSVENDRALNVLVKDSLALLMLDENIIMFDLSDPSSPEELWRDEMPNSFRYTTALWSRDWIYCYSPLGDIYIFLLQEEGNIIHDETIHAVDYSDMEGHLFDITIWSDYLFATFLDSGEYRLAAWDISDPGEPEEIAVPDDIEFDGNYVQIDVNDGVAVITSGSSLFLANVDPPEQSEVVVTWINPSEQSLYHPMLIENKIVLREGLTTLLSFGVDQDLEITPVDSIPLFSDNTPDLINYENLVYWADRSSGFSIIEVEDSGNFNEIINLDPVETFGSCSWIGDMMIVNTSEPGVFIFDGTSTDELSLLGSFLPEGQVNGSVHAFNSLIGISNWHDHHGGYEPHEVSTWLITAHPDDHFQPMLRSSLPASNHYAMVYEDSLLYSLLREGYDDTNLEIFDISDLDDPQLITSVELPIDDWVSDLIEYENNLYIFSRTEDYRYQIDIYSLNDPENPEEAATLRLEDHASSTPVFVNDLLLLAGPVGPTRVYSLEDPFEPVLIDTLFNRGSGIEILDHENNYLLTQKSTYESSFPDTIEIYDISNLENPERIAWYPITGNSINGYLEDDRIIISWGHGIGLFEWEPASVNNRDNTVMPSYPNLNVYPNPSNPNSIISVDLPVESLVRLEVFDLLGRQVTQLSNNTLTAGKHKFHLNSIAFPSSGTYYIRAKSDNWSETQKIVIIK